MHLDSQTARMPTCAEKVLKKDKNYRKRLRSRPSLFPKLSAREDALIPVMHFSLPLRAHALFMTDPGRERTLSTKSAYFYIFSSRLRDRTLFSKSPVFLKK